MLQAIKNFFDTQLTNPQSQVDEDHQLKLATAALLVEMMHQDDDVQTAEQDMVKSALGKKFNLSVDETDSLYMLAQQERKDATDYHQFTSLIAKHYTQDKKIKLVEYLWSVAYADGVLDKYEEHMVRRIADLIHVSHKDLMQTKHKFEQ